MATAIIGTGNIGGTLARHLIRGGDPVVLAAKDQANAAALAQDLGELARAASVEEAIADADAVVFAVWLDTVKELLADDARLLEKGRSRPFEPARVRRERADDPDAS
jgi:predicted dinucleotide-binding enzyme